MTTIEDEALCVFTIVSLVTIAVIIVGIVLGWWS